MKPIVNKTNFSMSYADLAGISKQKVNTVIRDITEFERFNVTLEKVNAFKAKVEEFDNTQIDQEHRGVIVATTEQKNELANKVRHLIRETTMYFRQTYGANSKFVNAMSISELSSLTDLELHRRAVSVVRVSKIATDELPSSVIGIVNELESTNEAFNNAIDTKSTLVELRDIAAHERVELANSIYKELMNYCEIGQVVWAETHEAKYNDYVIYRGSSYSSPPQNSDSGDNDREELPNE